MSHPSTPPVSRPDAGFSLIELMVALTVTLIVSGAVYGLLTSGQSAFRKEPAMADRQANIRAAMEMIVSDLRGAGAGMPPFTRVFTPGLDGPAGSPNSPVGGLTDELEFVTESSSRTGQIPCDSAANRIDVPETNSPFAQNQSFGIFMQNGEWTVRVATAVTPNIAPSGTCTAAGHTRVTFGAGPLVNAPAGICGAGSVGNSASAAGCVLVSVSYARAVAYRIRYSTPAGVSTNAITQQPFLERRTSDDWTWRQVMPGIEDLQVRYQLGPAGSAFVPVPNYFVPPVGTPDNPNINELNRLVRQVEVTLGARALGPILSGQTTALGGLPNAPRGRLVSITAMRPVFETLAQPGPSPLPQFR
jgi:prepilin-type N-terminal cleavage/methylation domain-containing protein